MIRGYLLDTNIVSYWFDEKREPERSRILKHINLLPRPDLLRTSAVVLGEIEYGHRVESPHANTSIQAAFSKFVSDNLPLVYPIGKPTTIYYGPLRARLFEKFAPKKKRAKALRPEQLLDPATSLELGIQENDLWIAAQAIEHSLVLVTHDQKMIRPLRQVLGGDLALDIEDWAA